MADTSQAFRRFLRWTFALSWGLGGIYLAARMLFPALPPLDSSNPLLIFIFCAPSIAGFIMGAQTPGGAALLLRRLVRPFGWRWLLVAGVAMPAATWIAGLIESVLGIAEAPTPSLAPFVAAATPAFYASVSAIGEEFGWRGWSLPLLLERLSPLTASLIIATVWIIWHVPAFFLAHVMAADASAFLWWAVSTTGLCCLMTFLHVSANGNLLVAGIIPHAVINALGLAGLWSARPAQALVLLVIGVSALLLRPARNSTGG